MKYNIGDFIIFKKIVNRYCLFYDDGQHKIAYISSLNIPYPVGQVVGFKYLKFGISNYDPDDGNSFVHKITVPCYEIKIGLTNKSYYVREQDIIPCPLNVEMENYKNVEVKIIPKCRHKCCISLGLIIKLKTRVRINDVFTFKNSMWNKRFLNDAEFIYEED